MAVIDRFSLWTVVFVFIAMAFLCGCEEQKYPWGRDTVDSFGDGRFHIVRAPTCLALGDYEDGIVVENVKSWKVKSEHVFLVDDKHQCWKVNYRTGTVKSYQNLDATEAEDRKIFEKLLK